jgi:hypothetical protein
VSSLPSSSLWGSLVAPERNSAWFRDRPRLGPAGCGGGGSHASANVQGGDATEHGDDIGDGVDDEASEITCVQEDDADDRREALGGGADADDVMVEHRPCRTIVKASVSDEEGTEDVDVGVAVGSPGSSSSQMAYSHPCDPSTSSPKATAELLASEMCVVCATVELLDDAGARASASGS